MSKERAHAAWRSAEQIKRLSDRLVGVGPIGIGLDGMLAWIPGANLVYGLSAGGLLLMHAVRAEAGAATLARMAGYLAVDNLTDAVPILGWAADMLFPGHLMAANALQKDIEKRHGLPADAEVSLRKKRLWSGRAAPASPSLPPLHGEGRRRSRRVGEF